MKMRNTAMVLLMAGLVSGCATGPDRKPGDPLEPMNRQIFKFNDALDRTIAQPVAKGYQKVTPQPLRQAISNFFSNLGDLGNAANNLLQLKITAATEDVMRFAMNSTFGIGGLIDFATPAGLPKHHEDFGLTLGRWGVPSGPYLVLPLFGPSSVRDSTGYVVDFRFNLTHYMEPAVRNPMYIAQFISARADLLGASSLLEAAALDKYSFVRDAYTQQRQSLLRGSSSTPAPLPNYGDPGAEGGASAAPATGASGAAASGLPDYSDPGDSSMPAAPANGASGTEPAGLPNYTDPGDSSMPAAPANGASGAAPGAAASPADKGQTAQSAEGASAAKAASAPAAASAAAAAAASGAAVPVPLKQ
ncbi:MlaA family lipoprotein [Paraburkholderia phenazinium]|jgi:phospholipid-binding lipoprotein MlaA|uniref:Phospholipid-binding lipoprotein MlaA n=1 Tax=Paraburkholderia phenazinium TaxID=60549 RepID=A0A1G7Q3Y3_9BURK|nr:VacJ family lipoprotein [Paraburkholderia phenazinium]SDF93262.1 phospholipid-binding lipoprotein MlaA [Paraburkholderia phenazinium]